MTNSYPATPPKTLNTFQSVSTFSQCSTANTSQSMSSKTTQGYRAIQSHTSQSQCPTKTEKPSPPSPTQKAMSSPPFPRPRSPMSPLCVTQFINNDIDTELLLPVTSKIIEREGSQMFRCSAVGMNGYRYYMEDAHVMYCGQSFGLFAVFDGHAGSECSSYFADKLDVEVAKLYPPLENHYLEELLLDMDTKFRQNQSTNSGSTAAIVIATPMRSGEFNVQVAHVGDSRVLIGRGNKLRFATTDHKPGNPKERERIEKYGGFVRNDRVDGRLAMSRALGDSDFKIGNEHNMREMRVTALPEISNLICNKQDFVVIACDGIFESMTNEEVIQFVHSNLMKTNDLGNIVGKLVDNALINGSTDNMTGMILQFKDGTKFRQPSEYLPGPYSVKQQTMFRNAYSHMVNKAGLTMECALAIRFHTLCDKLCRSVVEQQHNKLLSNTANMVIYELLSELKDMLHEIQWDINVIYSSIANVFHKYIKDERHERLSGIIMDFLKGSIDSEHCTKMLMNIPKATPKALMPVPATEKSKPLSFLNINSSSQSKPKPTQTVPTPVSRNNISIPGRERKSDTRAAGTWA